MGNQWHFDPDTYLAMVRGEIPEYDALQQALADSTGAVAVRSILDLGSGTGVTAQAVLSRHRDASLVGVDASPGMLDHARSRVPSATFVVGRLEDQLPSGPFDIVVSAFAIHHLDGPGKSDLFSRIASVLAPGGRFAFCDVVVPTRPVARPVPLEEGVDRPSSLAEQLAWLSEAGLRPHVIRAHDDLAIVAADHAER